MGIGNQPRSHQLTDTLRIVKGIMIHMWYYRQSNDVILLSASDDDDDDSKFGPFIGKDLR